jgi:hypothetical protein
MLIFRFNFNGVEWGLVGHKTEIIEGKEFRITVLPPDTRLQPARTRKRALWNTLSSAQKKQYLEAKRRATKKRRRRKKRERAG